MQRESRTMTKAQEGTRHLKGARTLLIQSGRGVLTSQCPTGACQGRGVREEHEQIVAMMITMWRPPIGDSFRPLFRFLSYLSNRPLRQPALRPHPYASVGFEVCWNIMKTTTARRHSKRNSMHYSVRTLLYLLLDERCFSTVSAST